MIKLLFLVESLRVGGAERSLTSLVKHLDKYKYDITILTIADGGYFADVIKTIPGIKYRFLTSTRSTLIDKLKIRLIYRWLSPKLIYYLFIPKGFDSEVAFCEGLGTKIIGASINRHAKHIAWIHTDLKENNWPVNHGVFRDISEEIKCYRNFDTIVGVSDTVCNRLREFVDNKNITRIYNIVDADDIREKSLEPSKYNHSKDKFNIVSVGRLEHVKGYDRLINVAARLANEGYYNFTLTIVGGGREYASLIDRIRKTGLEDIVTLTGMQPNPYSIIAGCDLFICPSRNEGFNIAIAEAMILGLPVISTWCPGPNEILQEGKYGILCENSEAGIYNAIKAFLDDPSLKDKYSKLSVEGQAMFNQDEILKQLYELI